MDLGIKAYNVKKARVPSNDDLKTDGKKPRSVGDMDTMFITDVIKSKTSGGSYRYRLVGHGTDGTNMSKFAKPETANEVAEKIGKEIKEKDFKAPKPRKTKAKKEKKAQESKEAPEVQESPEAPEVQEVQGSPEVQEVVNTPKVSKKRVLKKKKQPEPEPEAEESSSS